MLFAGCEQPVSSDKVSSSDYETLLESAHDHGGLHPVPVVSHNVSNFHPALSWNEMDNAIEYEIRREKCCSGFKIITTANTSYIDGEIIHPYLEDVDTAVPDKWLRYRVRAIYSDDESNWSAWKYFKIPDDQQW